MSVAHPYLANGKRLSKVAKTLQAWREEEELFFHITMGTVCWPVLTKPTVPVINRAGSSSATNLYFLTLIKILMKNLKSEIVNIRKITVKTLGSGLPESNNVTCIILFIKRIFTKYCIVYAF